MLPWLLFAAYTALDAIHLAADYLSLRYARGQAPERLLSRAASEFGRHAGDEATRRTTAYMTDQLRLGVARTLVDWLLVCALLFARTPDGLGLLGILDQWVRSVGLESWATGLLFVGAIVLARFMLSLPFAWAGTFWLEAKYGFNRTTPRTFIMDRVKGLILGAILGGLIFTGICAFFDQLGPSGWLWAWIAVVSFELAVTFIAPTWILPLFNRIEPIEPGPLHEAIQALIRRYQFTVGGVYKMDGSRRSSKANAFFTGFGPTRRLVLFDTLIEKHTQDELLAVLAHEIGHFRLGHIPRTIALSMGASCAMFYLLSLGLHSPVLFDAFGVGETSTYASLVLLAIAWSPISRLLSPLTMALSRMHEYQADAFAAKTWGNPDDLASALRKMSDEHLSNLTPHPLKILLDYTHPPVLERIERLRAAHPRSG